MTWTFIWLMVALKIPIAGLGYIVWWAIHETDEDELPVRNDDGGISRPPHPRTPLGPSPRRGPHGDPQPPAPPRTRPVVARGKTVKKD